MKPLRLGILLAAVIAGPPLWLLVRSDQLDSGAALERWGAVAAICSLAASGLAALVRAYEEQMLKQKRQKLIDEAQEAIDATRAADRVA